MFSSTLNLFVDVLKYYVILLLIRVWITTFKNANRLITLLNQHLIWDPRINKEEVEKEMKDKAHQN